MLSPEDEFIIDAVAHPYNNHPDNYADVASASTISELAAAEVRRPARRLHE